MNLLSPNHHRKPSRYRYNNGNWNMKLWGFDKYKVYVCTVQNKVRGISHTVKCQIRGHRVYMYCITLFSAAPTNVEDDGCYSKTGKPDKFRIPDYEARKICSRCIKYYAKFSNSSHAKISCTYIEWNTQHKYIKSRIFS